MKLKQLRIISWLLVCAFVLGVTPLAWADDAQSSDLADLVRELQTQMNAMQKTINQQNDKIRQLEVQKPQVQVAPSVMPSGSEATSAPMSDYEFNQRLEQSLGGANKWLKDLKFKGDIRLRYEAFDYTHGPPSTADDSRNRFRYRLRFGLEKPLMPDMKIGFGLCSGSISGGVNNDPTSTNQTLDGLFNFKPIFIEKVYASYSPSWAKTGPVKNFTITGGKFDNPFELGSSDMIWDRDVKPEGAYEKIDFDLLNTSDIDMSAFVTGGQFILDEDGLNSGGDAQLWALQAGINPTFYTPFFDKPVDWLSAVSYYAYDHYAHSTNFLIDGTTRLSGASATDARGNPVLGNGTDLAADHFNTVEVYNELALPLWKPLRLFHDFAINPKDATPEGFPRGQNQAWAIGAKLNGIVQKGDWELSYAYKWIGHSAVVGAFNDSDFGDGHSGKRGSVIKGGYALTDNLTLNGAMYFVNDTSAGTAGYLDKETRRFQVDLAYKF
ncbi:MAG TPA: putative porin [Candidatus Omnitrophota bacterium]|nr:putative porin [Candidatus Omnitrophota bacterium]